MSRRSRTELKGFTCIHCRQQVSARAIGSQHRNHCPYCLWSRHVDIRPGDRGCGCRGAMAPVAIDVHSDGEWSIIHRCTGCGALRTNRIAGDDQELALLQLVLRPLAHPPFPLDALPTWNRMPLDRGWS
ncbi:MAG: RNHCP domain-containing protein [Phycisphaerales bacterium]|nr:MAG: RNHCP domain-containing protein [Phycisphaerales bacterium]